MRTGSTAQAQDASWPSNLVSVFAPDAPVRSSYEASGQSIEKYAELAITFAEGASEVQRRALTQRRIDILHDRWGPLLKAAFASWVTPEVRKAVIGERGDHIDLSRNPAKRIWEELATSYRSSPRRTTPDDRQEAERYIELVERTGFHLFWQRAERLLAATNDVLLWPRVIERGGRKLIRHHALTGGSFSLIGSPEDATLIDCVIVIDSWRDAVGHAHRRYQVWTDSDYLICEVRCETLFTRTVGLPPFKPSDIVAAGKNPYGAIPQIHVRSDPASDELLDYTSGEDLVHGTLGAGEERLFYRYLQKMSGFKQLAALGAEAEETQEQQLLDPGALLKIPTERALLIDWTVALKDRLECMSIDEISAAASRGINPQRYRHSSDYQTTFGARRADRGLVERRTRSAEIWREAERQYREMLCRVARAHGVPDVPTTLARLDIDFAPSFETEDPSAQASVNAADIAMGLASAISILMQRNPDWTEDQARAALIKNMTDTAWVNEIKASRQIANDPRNQDRQSEIDGATGPEVRDAPKDAAGAEGEIADE